MTTLYNKNIKSAESTNPQHIKCKMGERVTVIFEKGDYPFSSWVWFVVNDKQQEIHSRTSVPTSIADDFIGAMQAGEDGLSIKLTELKLFDFVQAIQNMNKQLDSTVSSVSVAPKK